MFALWHMLRLSAQPARWSARMVLTVLVLAVLSLSWQAADALPDDTSWQVATTGHSGLLTLEPLLLR